jgi:class 3 adenylate cyclase
MTWKTITYRWHWQLKSSPARLWPYVADTQRFNQASGLPTIDYLEIPLEQGGSRRIGRATRFGVVVEYEDYPFEWVQEEGFSNLRVFSRGPIARTYARLRLEPNPTGTLLHYEAEVTPANFLGWLGTPYQFGWEMRRNFERVFRQIDEALQSQEEVSFSLKPPPLSRLALERLNQLSQQLVAQGYEMPLVRRLTQFLVEEPDFNLTRLRPYVLADRWQTPRRLTLELFLSAAKLGLLRMRWDIICPLCRGAKVSATSLDEIPKGSHCSTCNIDFEGDFSQNVELTFAAHPQIRLTYDESYCIGGPMVTPHILIHQLLEPGETRTLSPIRLAEGAYHLRTQQPKVEQWLELAQALEEQATILAVAVEASAIQVNLVETAPATNGREDKALALIITNKAPYRQRLYIERAAWYTDAVTAAQVTALQHFRDLFSDEVLRPGEEIGIQGMAILFSDLVGSTAMYNRWGDAASYSLVREQFAFLQRIVRQYEGAIVKTIGDAIMAAFFDPAKAVEAALTIQREINSFNATHPDEPLRIKLGVHYGPCIAVNLNGRLDYFGATVNLAARLEGQSQGGDVVISGKVYDDPAVQALLTSTPVQAGRFTTAIKGFDENFCLYRLHLMAC